MSLKGRLAAVYRRLGGPKGGKCCCRGVQQKTAAYYNNERRPRLADEVCADCGGLREALLIHVRHVARRVGVPLGSQR